MKIWVRLGLQFYCSKIVFDKKHMYTGDAPLILAANHPNSFLDALIIGAYYPRKFHFLARGDAFNKPWANRILRNMYLVPVYRMSEGRTRMSDNDASFTECADVLQQNGAVLIFSEGMCIHQTELLPLKKGTARIAYLCKEGRGLNSLMVQPLALSYSSFSALPRQVHISCAPAFNVQDCTEQEEAAFLKEFNDKLQYRLSSIVTGGHYQPLVKKHPVYKALLALPAVIGFVLHRALYVQWKQYIKHKVKDPTFTDSVFFASLLLLYPLVVLLITILMVVFSHSACMWLLLIFIPFTAWAYKEYKAA
jgi:1-acyl-sn-glycerol-3-phosphate acyltransferase